MSDIDNSILNAFFWLNTLVFLFYSSISTFVLLKLHFKLDNVSLLSMAAAFTSFLIRFINWLVHKIQGFETQGDGEEFSATFLTVDTIATTVFLMNAYFFVFEMKIVHEQIKSKSHQEFIKRETRVKRLRNIFMGLAIVIHAVFVFILISKYANSQGESNFSSIFFILFLVAALTRFTMDGYIFMITILYFKFVVSKRIEIMRERGATFNCQSKFVIFWLLFVIILIAL